MLKNSAILYNI